MLHKLPIKAFEIIVQEGQLSQANVLSLLLTSRHIYSRLSSRQFNLFLLSHYYPFAPETNALLQPNPEEYAAHSNNIPFPSLQSPPHPSPLEALNALSRRIHRLRTKDWAAEWEFQFSAYDPEEPLNGRREADMWFSDGFFLVDVAGGFLLTAETNVRRGEIVISVGHLENRSVVKIVAPIDPFKITKRFKDSEGRMLPNTKERFEPLSRPGIYMRHGKVLLVYDNPHEVESMIMLMDGSFDGRCLWRCSLRTKVFLGIEPTDFHLNMHDGGDIEAHPPSMAFHRRLQPEFNEHYVAFLDGYGPSTNPTGNLMICRFVSSNPMLALDCFTTEFVITREVLSFKPDSRGRMLMVASRLPGPLNTHRVTLIDAGGATDGEMDKSGTRIRDCDMIMARLFREGSRDMDYHLAEDNSKLLIYGSSHLDNYRKAVLGQISSFDLTKPNSKGKQRYLLNPSPDSSVCSPFSGVRTNYNFELGTLTYPQRTRPDAALETTEPRFVRYESLNLNVKSAGFGTVTNPHNTRPARWMSSIPAPFLPHDVEIRRNNSKDPNGASSHRSITREYHQRTELGKNWLLVLSERQTTTIVYNPLPPSPPSSVANSPNTPGQRQTFQLPTTKSKFVVRLYCIGEPPPAPPKTPTRSASPRSAPRSVSHSRHASSDNNINFNDPFNIGNTIVLDPLPDIPVQLPGFSGRGSISGNPVKKTGLRRKNDLPCDDPVASKMHAKLLAYALESEREKQESLSPKKSRKSEKAGARALGMRLQNKSATWGQGKEEKGPQVPEKSERRNNNSLHPDTAKKLPKTPKDAAKSPKDVYHSPHHHHDGAGKKLKKLFSKKK